MNDIAEKLILILEDLYAKQHEVDEIALSLLGIKEGLPSGPGYLNWAIYELELIFVKCLGGNEKHFYYCKELKKEKDPFDNFEYGNINRSEFLKQINRVIELDLKIE